MPNYFKYIGVQECTMYHTEDFVLRTLCFIVVLGVVQASEECRYFDYLGKRFDIIIRWLTGRKSFENHSSLASLILGVAVISFFPRNIPRFLIFRVTARYDSSSHTAHFFIRNNNIVLFIRVKLQFNTILAYWAWIWRWWGYTIIFVFFEIIYESFEL